MRPLARFVSADEAVDSLRACLSPASFWTPERLGPQISWVEHAPFAFWLVEVLRPRTLVELGTHGGFSYFTMCEAVQRVGLNARCYAVDTWTGDEHAGFYGEEVYRDVLAQNERRYSGFSTLIRSTFDDALRHFSNRTIDLLHIDGRHFYDDVKHDFASWQEKLSASAVVLFHDSNVRERDFGVFRLWEELRQSHPHFEFLHGHGLGVLAVGTELPPSFRQLLDAADDPEATSHIRNAYARLGSAISLTIRERDLSLRADRLESDAAQARIETETAHRELAAASDELARLSRERAVELAGLTAEVAQLTANVVQERAAAESALHALTGQKAEIARLTADMAGAQAAAESAQHTLAAQNEALRHDLEQLAQARLRVADLETQLAARATEQARLATALLPAADDIAELEAQLAAASENAARLQKDLAAARSGRAELEEKLATRTAEAARQGAELVRTHAHAGQLARELDKTQRDLEWMLSSTSWRLTRPLRRLGTTSPKLTRYGRKLMNSLGLRGTFRPEAGAAVGPSGRGRSGRVDLAWLKSRVGTPATANERAKNCRILEASGLLDERAYRVAAGIDARISAAEHYLTVGWRQGIEPGSSFDGRFLAPYYRSVGFDGPPAITYLKLRAHGWPVHASRAEAEAIAHVIRANDFFDVTAYAAAAGDLSGLDPILHYVIVGERAGLAPSDRFDPEYYGERYPDVGQQPMNRLEHYLMHGRIEGRRPLPLATMFECNRSRLRPTRDTVLLVAHEATRTGAPILTYNIAKRLRRTSNVVVVLLDGGELVEDFHNSCSAVIGPLVRTDSHPVELKYLVNQLLAAYPISYAIINSIESSRIVQPLARALIPTVLLVHEFASYTRPRTVMREGLDWATQIVFSAELVARSAREEHPAVQRRALHILPQGRTERPAPRETIENPAKPADLVRSFRPPGAENAFVVMGCGFVHLRKGVDIFLLCAAAVAALCPSRPVRFVWVGKGYDPENDATYSCYLAEQIARSRLQEMVEFTGEIADVEAAYALSDLFFLTSRLDPLPNVAIDATLEGLPVICFEGTTGMAEILCAHSTTRECVIPHLAVQAAAELIVDLANDEPRRRRLAEACRNLGRTTFDMNRYVTGLRELGSKSIAIMHQRKEDLATLSDDPMFDPQTYMPTVASPIQRRDAVIDFLARWAAVGTTPNPDDYSFRRPCPGFHPQIYAHAHFDTCHATGVNPLAHFIRSGKPDGPWCHGVITPTVSPALLPGSEAPRTALHAHFHYPDLAEDFVRKIGANGARCDLLLSTDDDRKARILRKATSHYLRGEVLIRVTPNRGRDIGAFLTGFAEDIQGYSIIGHVHGKRSPTVGGQSDPHMGDRWREFLWQNLLGDQHPMMDVIIAKLAVDEALGLVFPDDPHLCDWRENRPAAEQLIGRIGIKDPLPPFFDFPIGTMFWARTAALEPLFALKLRWDDYPPEPVPYDGTILHALERLLPFVARHAGYRFATTHVPGVTW